MKPFVLLYLLLVLILPAAAQPGGIGQKLIQKKCGVMMDSNLFPMFTVGHQFYVLGSKEYRQKTRRVGYSISTIVPVSAILGMGTFFSASATAGVDVASGTTRTLRIFRVNPVTGMITE